MQPYKARKCHGCTKLKVVDQLVHCCSPQTLICDMCKPYKSCAQCFSPYSQLSKCHTGCPCPLNQQQFLANRRPHTANPPRDSNCRSCFRSLQQCSCGKLNQPCGNCRTPFPTSLMFCSLNCTHRFCKECVKESVERCFCGQPFSLDVQRQYPSICRVCSKGLAVVGNTFEGRSPICIECSDTAGQQRLSSPKQGRTPITRQSTISKFRIKLNFQKYNQKYQYPRGRILRNINSHLRGRTLNKNQNLDLDPGDCTLEHIDLNPEDRSQEHINLRGRTLEHFNFGPFGPDTQLPTPRLPQSKCSSCNCVTQTMLEPPFCLRNHLVCPHCILSNERLKLVECRLCLMSKRQNPYRLMILKSPLKPKRDNYHRDLFNDAIPQMTNLCWDSRPAGCRPASSRRV